MVSASRRRHGRAIVRCVTSFPLPLAYLKAFDTGLQHSDIHFGKVGLRHCSGCGFDVWCRRYYNLAKWEHNQRLEAFKRKQAEDADPDRVRSDFNDEEALR